MESGSIAETAAHETERVHLRDVINLLPETTKEEEDFKRRMIAKYDQIVSGEARAYRRFSRLRTRNNRWIAAIIVAAALVPASAILPIGPFTLGGWTVEPEQVTGLIGVALSAILAMYQALGLRARQSWT